MPRPPKQTKAETLQKLKQVFRDHGYEGASMQALSEATGLSKASLYHHFPDGKQEMASQVLLEEGRKLQSLVLAPLSEKRNGEALLDSLVATAEFYDSDTPQCLMNSLTLGEGAGCLVTQSRKRLPPGAQRWPPTTKRLVRLLKRQTLGPPMRWSAFKALLS